MELITILEKTVSPDRLELEAAQKFLERAAVENLPTFLVELSRVLANPGNSQVARVAAGLQIKNSLTSKIQISRHNISRGGLQLMLMLDGKLRITFCRLWAQKLTGLVLPHNVWLVLLVQRSR